MKIIDISWPISTATTGYKDRYIVEFDEIKSLGKDHARETIIHLSSHTGTHVDAPSHMLKDGKTIDELPLDRFVGPCKVVDMTDVVEKITRDWFEDQNLDIVPGDIILLKTINSATSPTEKFTPHFVYLEISGAQYLAEKKIKAVGIDYLGIEHSQPGHLTHQALFHADIGIIEGLRLQHVKSGSYLLVCLPLYTIGVEAAPARAVLLTDMK
jgi:arylformamidase